jgi:SAM-dependent methyltransferase
MQHLSRFLRAFCQSPWCDGLVRHQNEWAERVLSKQFGYYALQLGVAYSLKQAWDKCPIRHKIVLADVPLSGVDVVCDYRDLAIKSDSIDLILLQHVLEQVDDPYALLREVERLLINDGCVVVMGFAPLNAWRGQWFGRHKHAASQVALFAPGRVVDGLQTLGFEIQQVSFYPESGWQRWLPWLATPFSQGYALIAQKKTSRVKLIGLRDGWRWQSLLPQLARRNITEKVNREAS